MAKWGNAIVLNERPSVGDELTLRRILPFGGTRSVRVIGVNRSRRYSAIARGWVWDETVKVREDGTGPVEVIPFEVRTAVVGLRQ